MTMYASNAGKSGGEFFTPQEVSELLARITVVGKTAVNKVYDPACGSGSLLLKFAKVLGKDNVRQGFFGQEINLTTYNLCRINMFLHDVNYEKFDIAHGDTLTRPGALGRRAVRGDRLQPAVLHQVGGRRQPAADQRPALRAGRCARAEEQGRPRLHDAHAVSWLAVNGTAAIVEFPGVLYRGGAEQKIRKYLIDNNYVDTVIQLPPDLFFGTTIATCIIVLKKSKTDNTVLFIDASAEFLRLATRTSSARRTSRRSSTLSPPARTPTTSRSSSPNSEVAENSYNIACQLLCRGRGHARGSGHQGAERRDRQDRRAPVRAAEPDRRDRR